MCSYLVWSNQISSLLFVDQNIESPLLVQYPTIEIIERNVKILFTCSVRDAFRGQLRVRIGGRGDIRGGRFVIVRPCPAVGGRDGEKEPDTFYRGPQL